MTTSLLVRSSALLAVLLVTLAPAVTVAAFVTPARSTSFSGSSTVSTPVVVHTRGDSVVLAAARIQEEIPSYLLEDFMTAQGEVLNPYKVLKVKRDCARQDIKKAYRDLSRRYHPDGMRHRDILPGSCNNLDEVRDHWERIKLSYEILSDAKMRKRFDRNTAIADPGKAMQRAALDAVGNGIMGMGKGIFDMGFRAVTQLAEKDQSETKLP